MTIGTAATLTRRSCLRLGGAGLLAGILPGCERAADGRFTVATTFTIIADMARNVAGELAAVVSITKPGAEIHNYQPTPGDLLRTRDADLLLWNGLNLELWFERFFDTLGGIPDAVVTEGIPPIDISGGEYAGKPNPHAWMSPAAAQTYVDNIAAAMSRYDGANAAAYQANAARYKQQIEAAIAPIRAQFDRVPPNRRWLATSEGAFSYLARDFGLRELYLWPINADQQGTPQQIREVIDTVRRENVPVIFSESTVSPKPAQQVASETGARYGGVLYVDTLTGPEGPVPTYLDLLRYTSAKVAEGLTG